MNKFLFSISAAIVITPSFHGAQKLETLEILSLREKLENHGVVKDVIEKTEVISHETIEKKQAKNVSEAIENEVGVKVSNECSMCGIKRVMINGMKGEHTTLLVDDVPSHSLVSSFYGMDAISTSGIERIELARGTGASLIAPEAIGGTVNIITKKPTKQFVSLDSSIGNHGFSKHNLSAAGISEDGKTRVLLNAQTDDVEQVDEDNNGVSESPSLQNRSVSLKWIFEPNHTNSYELRYANYYSDIFGGPMDISRDAAIASYSNPATANPGLLFQGGDVNGKYTGHPFETTEAITTKREEISFKWLKEINEMKNFAFTFSHIDHEQDSFYEGFDYDNEEDTLFFDLRYNRVANESHLLTWGMDHNEQEMRSTSMALQTLKLTDPTLTGDSFDTERMGFYLQDTWTPRDSIEISLAVRYDNIKVDWIEKVNQGNEIDKELLSPRFHMRMDHNQFYSSRLSYGKGYRAPVSFFESDHGILESGFNIGVDSLEKSDGFGYSLSYESARKLNWTFSWARTNVQNLAFIDTDNFTRPTLINMRQEVSVDNFDIVFGYRMTENWNLGMQFEKYDYDSLYKSTFSVAPVETRQSFNVDYVMNQWELGASIIRVGSRNLDEYGYGGRFNDYAGTKPKKVNADSFFTVNFRAKKTINQNWSWYVGVNNLFDYTQTKDEESPLFYDGVNGDYDVAHIWGPLKGRTVYAGIQTKF
jgi:outer membrane receptor protein involved in Fe transport